MSFDTLGLVPELLRALAEQGYTAPTPIQSAAIPVALSGRDLLAGAQTGTGKTAAFALPLLQRLFAIVPPGHGKRKVRALVLTPTRELAAQVHDSLRGYARHQRVHSAAIFGGVGMGGQIEALRRGMDVLVATPGRLIDHMDRRTADLSGVEILVLDEADRMLDMGFIHDVKRIVAKLPAKRQTLLFSATMPEQIAQLAKTLLKDPVRIDVVPQATTAERVDQRVIYADRGQKPGLLLQLLADPDVERALVFTRTKHGADRVATQLERAGVGADAIHGNKSQNARQKALADFAQGRIRVLVATDIAARGIDIDGVTHVINYELPNLPESYVHRIGRTARAGASGIALSFCAGDERAFLRDIERLIGRRLAVIDDHGLAVSNGHGEDRGHAPRERKPEPGRNRQGRGRGWRHRGRDRARQAA